MITAKERDYLSQALDKIPFEVDCLLKKFSRYKTGGVGKIVVYPNTELELVTALENLKGKYPIFIVGGGSNLLISDKGFDGVIISTQNLDKVTFKSNLVTCECGAKISDVIKESTLNSLSGLEFLVGVPATVGGAVAMNAGCFNKSIADVVCYVVTDKGTYSGNECEFDYRKSRFLNGETILKVCFSLTPTDYDIIEDKIKTYQGLRRNPKGRSCGSVFKNDGYFAGKVIDEVGLKGYKIGGAKISESHANFIITEDGATSTDVYNLIKLIKQKVYDKKQIELKEEIVYLGEFK
jgi:UDP-N-acetylmuramate dehydrogenase